MSLSLSRPARLDHAEGEDLGAAAGRAGRDALALQVLELGDAVAFERHDLHQVDVHDDQGPDRQLLGKLVPAVDGIDRGVDLGEGDVGIARADQLHVVERAAGHLGGRSDAGNLLGDDGAEAARQRIVDAAGAAGGNRELFGLLSIGGRAPERECGPKCESEYETSYERSPWTGPAS